MEFGGKKGASATSRVNVLLNRTKTAREKEAQRAPKVGSAAVVSADEWLATAAANRDIIARRRGTLGNPFTDARSLLKESDREKDTTTNFFALPLSSENDQREYRGRLPGLYWDHELDSHYGTIDYVDIDTELSSDLFSQSKSDIELPKSTDKSTRNLSHQQERSIEISVLELRDSLEEDTCLSPHDIDLKCDALRDQLTTQALHSKGIVIAFDDDNEHNKPPQKIQPTKRRQNQHHDSNNEPSSERIVERPRLPSSSLAAVDATHGIVFNFDDDD